MLLRHGVQPYTPEDLDAHAALEALSLAGAAVDRSSRASIARWGHAAADINPDVARDPSARFNLERVAEAGADVVRACE